MSEDIGLIAYHHYYHHNYVICGERGNRERLNKTEDLEKKVFEKISFNRISSFYFL